MNGWINWNKIKNDTIDFKHDIVCRFTDCGTR